MVSGGPILYFIGVNETVFTFEDKINLNEVATEYTQWTNQGDDFWRIDETSARNGSASSSFYYDKDMDRSALWTLPSEIKRLDLKFYVQRYSAFADTWQRLIYIKIKGENGESYVLARVDFTKDAGGFAYRFQGGLYVGTVGGAVDDSTGTGELESIISNWIGIRITADLNTGKAELYIDLTDSGVWSYIGDADWTAPSGDFAYAEVYTDAAGTNVESIDFTDDIFLDDLTFDLIENITPTDQAIYLSHVEFENIQEGFGKGYVTVIHKDHDNSDYYELEEQSILITDHNGRTVFRGEITNVSAVDDGVRLDIASAHYKLEQRHCKVDYQSAKGSVSAVTATQIQDASKSWAADEWNGYGVIVSPNPQEHVPFAFATMNNTVSIALLPRYSGYGIGVPDDGTGTYVSAKGFELNKTDTRQFTVPQDAKTAVSVLSKEAILTSSNECIRTKWNSAIDPGTRYPIVDTFIKMGDIPYGDLIGFKVRVQAAIRNAAQSAGIAVKIFVYDTTNDDGSGTWEELTGKTGGAPRITTVDADGVGIWGWFEQKFQIAGGSADPDEYIELDESSYDKYIFEWREKNSAFGDTGNREQIMRIMIIGIDDVGGQSGHGMEVGFVSILPIRLGTDTNQYAITDTTPPSTLVVSTNPTSLVGEGDIYLIAPSLSKIIGDLETAEAGATHSFSIYDTMSDGDTKYLAVNLFYQRQSAVLRHVKDYAEKTWWYNPETNLLQIGEEADLSASGLSLTTGDWIPNTASLNYRQDMIVGTVIAIGNKSLGLVYVKTDSADGTQEIVIPLYSVSSYAELKIYADNFFSKWSTRQPLFRAMIDYENNDEYYKLRPGYTVPITYKNLSAETLPIFRSKYIYDAPKKAYLIIECGRYGSTPYDEVAEYVNDLERKVHDLLLAGVQQDYTVLTDRRITVGTGEPTTAELTVADQYNYSTTGKTGWDKDARDTVNLTFANATRTFETEPVGDTIEFWVNGSVFSKNGADQVQIDDTEGLWYIYFDENGTLTASQTAWEFSDDNKAMVAIIYWDATNNEHLYLGNELHTFHMDAHTHEWAHNTFGLRFETGLAITDNADGTITLTSGTIYDEDLEIYIEDDGAGLYGQVLSPAEVYIYYRDGANGYWRQVVNGTSNTYLAYQDGSENPYWNEYTGGSWGLNAAADNTYVAYWIVATNDQAHPVIMIMGQGAESATLQGAINNNDLADFVWGTILPAVEFKVLYRVIIQNAGSPYTVSQIDDFRGAQLLSGSGFLASDHGALAGLDDDDHAQYVLADGSRTITGAIIIEDITIASPSNIYLLSHDSFADFEAGEHYPVIDEDNMASNSDVHVPTQQSVKAYIDAIILTEDTLAEMNDVNVTPTNEDIIVYDSGTSKWVDKTPAEYADMIEDHIVHDNLSGFEAGEHYPVIDEDDMSSDSDAHVPTQQSVKAYVDGQAGGGISDIVEDLTPQLGGDLDLNGHNLDFPTVANISDCLDEDTMASNSATKLATQQSIKAYVDVNNAIGSANVDRIACVHMGINNATQYYLAQRCGYKNYSGTEYTQYFMVPKECNRGNESLRLTKLYLYQWDIDVNNAIDQVTILGVKDGDALGGTQLDALDWNTVKGTTPSNNKIEWDFTNINCDGYEYIYIEYIINPLGTAGNLDYSPPIIEYYYD